MEYIEIGQRIKNRRKTLGISAVELAERLSMSKATIHRYENGDIKNIKLPIAESIARELKVNPLWLLGKSQNLEPTNAIDKCERHKHIEYLIEDITEYVRSTEGLRCYGKILTEEDRKIIISGLETLKMLAAIKCR